MEDRSSLLVENKILAKATTAIVLKKSHFPAKFMVNSDCRDDDIGPSRNDRTNVPGRGTDQSD